jgi:hypothetical protein
MQCNANMYYLALLAVRPNGVCFLFLSQCVRRAGKRRTGVGTRPRAHARRRHHLARAPAACPRAERHLERLAAASPGTPGGTKSCGDCVAERQIADDELLVLACVGVWGSPGSLQWRGSSTLTVANQRAQCPLLLQWRLSLRLVGRWVRPLRQGAAAACGSMQSLHMMPSITTTITVRAQAQTHPQRHGVS